jgi:superoxide oxidase
MNWRNTTERYGILSMGLHWLMLLLLVAVYACIELREMYPKGSDPREALKTWHFMLGLSVPLLLSLRLMALVIGVVPRTKPDPGKLQTLSAKLIHLALYVLMIGMPLTGWLILSAAGKPIPFFGLELPALIDVGSKELVKQIEEVHEAAGTIGYILVGVHAVAALAHHYLIKDNTLLRMLPERG